MENPKPVDSGPSDDPAIDGAIQLVANRTGHHQSIISLYLSSTKSFEIINLQISIAKLEIQDTREAGLARVVESKNRWYRLSDSWQNETGQ